MWRWRPKWKKDSLPRDPQKKSLRFDLMCMSSWDYIYKRCADSSVSSVCSMYGIEWITTERVVIVHMKTWDTEKWVLITKH